MGFLKRHSLSIALAGIWLGFVATSYLTTPDDTAKWLGEMLLESAGGAFGGLIMVLFTKVLVEAGSKESKNRPEDDD